MVSPEVFDSISIKRFPDPAQQELTLYLCDRLKAKPPPQDLIGLAGKMHR